MARDETARVTNERATHNEQASRTNSLRVGLAIHSDLSRSTRHVAPCGMLHAALCWPWLRDGAWRGFL
jgi:hypothetical protein